MDDSSIEENEHQSLSLHEYLAERESSIDGPVVATFSQTLGTNIKRKSKSNGKGKICGALENGTLKERSSNRAPPIPTKTKDHQVEMYILV